MLAYTFIPVFVVAILCLKDDDFGRFIIHHMGRTRVYQLAAMCMRQIWRLSLQKLHSVYILLLRYVVICILAIAALVCRPWEALMEAPGAVVAGILGPEEWYE